MPSPGPFGVLAIYALAGATALAWRHLPGTRRRRAAALLAVGAIAACATLALRARMPAPPRDLTISFLDVGQGDATLIQHGAAAVLVDTGPPGAPDPRAAARRGCAAVRRARAHP